VLRDVAHEILPLEVVNHRKWGFGVPWNQYLRQIPVLHDWIGKLPDIELIRSSPLRKELVREVTERFLKGDDQWAALVKQLFFISLWYKVCIEKERQILTST
jgi:hypothetical protein